MSDPFNNPNHAGSYHFIPGPINQPFPKNHGGPGLTPPGFESPVCKASYVGAPIKAWAHHCVFCDKRPAECKCKGGPKFPNGVCAVVVDDINEKVYLYGNIIHENYHVPGNNCVPYAAVGSAGFEKSGRLSADEFFVGEQDNNNVKLSNMPIRDNSNTFLVFLNGLKQREGAEHDYIVTGDTVHFNFYTLLPTDTVEVMYDYGAI